MGSGGRRPGSGRKPKTKLELEVTGYPGHRGGRVLAHPGAGQGAVVAPIDEFEAPDDLTLPERQVWLELAPHAFQARTLTKATALSFRLLCRNVTLERELGAKYPNRGGSDHRGLILRVDAELLRFGLSPCGKALYEAEKPAVNPLERFISRKRN